MLTGFASGIESTIGFVLYIVLRYSVRLIYYLLMIYSGKTEAISELIEWFSSTNHENIKEFSDIISIKSKHTE